MDVVNLSKVLTVWSRRRTLETLITHAASLGCRVYFLPLDDEWEGYFADGNAIVVNSRMTENYQREVLAHELGHAYYGHDWRSPHDKDADEIKADLYAARVLISPTEYAQAEALCEHPGAIAKELNISQHLVMVWQKWMKGEAA